MMGYTILWAIVKDTVLVELPSTRTPTSGRLATFNLGLKHMSNEGSSRTAPGIASCISEGRTGNFFTTSSLVLIYMNHDREANDFTKAPELFRRAADGGNTAAVFNVG